MPPATLSIVSPRTNVKNSSKSLIFFIFFPFRVVAKQVGVGPPRKGQGIPPVGGNPCPFGEALRCFDLPRFAWATGTRKVVVGVCSGLASFLAGMARTEKGRKKAAAFLGRKSHRPLRARNRMERNGKGMSAKGTALAVSGLRHPPKVERNADAGAGIRSECP